MKLETRCDRCGKLAVVKVKDEQLCEECYQTAGSCCPEFGGDDLWEVEEKKPDQPEKP